MNVQSSIKKELWIAISKSYESGIYTAAILDSIRYLTDTIREKAGIDGDGHSLIGQSLGGDNPKLRINKFQTQTEKDEQRGFAELLRGIYSAIRNPRSHEQVEDSQEHADAIIIFVNYILSVIDTSKGPFVLEDWLERVYDPDFVASSRYADILVKDVPARRRLDAMINLYRGKDNGNGENIQLMFYSFLKAINETELTEFTRSVSSELRTERDEGVIIQAIQCLPSELWPRIEEDARIRIENKLIRSIKEGKSGYKMVRNSSGRTVPQKVEGGVLGTWALDLVHCFTLREELSDAIYNLLCGQEQENLYVVKHFISELPVIAGYSSEKDREDKMIDEIVIGITTANFTALKKELAKNIEHLPDSWRTRILSRTGPLAPPPPVIDDDDIPF